MSSETCEQLFLHVAAVELHRTITRVSSFPSDVIWVQTVDLWLFTPRHQVHVSHLGGKKNSFSSLCAWLKNLHAHLFWHFDFKSLKWMQIIEWMNIFLPKLTKSFKIQHSVLYTFLVLPLGNSVYRTLGHRNCLSCSVRPFFFRFICFTV